MVAENTEITLTSEERKQYKALAQSALKSLPGYNGSEVAEQRLFEPLLAMDAFVKSKNNGQSSAYLEHQFLKEVMPDSPFKAIDDFLQSASDSYIRHLRNARGYEDILSLLEQGGGVVKHSVKAFVQTDDGQIKDATSPAPNPVEHKTQPRLAMVIQHLKDEGVYTDDIIAHTCNPDPKMVRKLPYIVLQIPRLNKEIAVCDEVGEITFVADKILGTDVWANLSKDQLKARPEITAVRFNNEKDWWDGISQVLHDKHLPPENKKVDVVAFSKKKEPLDIDLIKQCILEHWQQTGDFPTDRSGVVQYGSYKDKESWRGFDAALSQGNRGLPGGSSLPALNKEVSDEHGLDYVNRLQKDDLDINIIKNCILEHRRQTGEWPTARSGVVQYGEHKDKETWVGIQMALSQGNRGLPGGSSLPALNKEVSDEYKLDYVNRLQKDDLDINIIKNCILEHRRQTGKWPTQQSGVVQYGEYKDKESWKNLDTALSRGGRGLAGGSSLSDLNQEVSDENGLDYVKKGSSQKWTEKVGKTSPNSIAPDSPHIKNRTGRKLGRDDDD